MAHLIFQTAFIGDALLTVPLIKQIRKLYPDTKPSIVCRHALVPLFEGLGLVERAYGIDKKNTSDWVQLKKNLKQKSWQILFCPHQSYRSAFFTRSLKAQERVAFAQWWNGPFFTTRVNYNAHLPEALRALSLLAAVNSDFAQLFHKIEHNPAYHSPTIRETITEWDKLIPPWADMTVAQNADQIIATHQKFNVEPGHVFIAPGSVWPTKRWTISGFISVAQNLLQRGYKVYLTGDKSDDLIAQDIASALPLVVNLCGKTSLLELHALFSKAQVVLSNDSSPIHMAALAGTPVVAIFGPTTLGLGYRPWTSQSKVVQKNLSCRPCGKHGHNTCPIGTHACMREITSENVIQALQQLTL